MSQETDIICQGIQKHMLAVTYVIFKKVQSTTWSDSYRTCFVIFFFCHVNSAGFSNHFFPAFILPTFIVFCTPIWNKQNKSSYWSNAMERQIWGYLHSVVKSAMKIRFERFPKGANYESLPFDAMEHAYRVVPSTPMEHLISVALLSILFCIPRKDDYVLE